MSEGTLTGQPAPPTGAAALPASTHPVTVVVRVRLEALAIPEPDGGYSVIVPALPGCVSAADAIEDVQANIVEAAEGWLDSQHDLRKAEALRVALGE